MAVAAALALAPALRVAPRDLATETEALLGVAGWAAQFAPGVALEFPDGVLLEVSGSLKLFGGLESLLGRLRRGLAEMGWSSVLAGAPTPRAAFWLALVGKQKFIGESAELEPVLAALPLEVLRCNDEALAAFEAIGVRTLGELHALPREGIARRFACAMPRRAPSRPDSRPTRAFARFASSGHTPCARVEQRLRRCGLT